MKIRYAVAAVLLALAAACAQSPTSPARSAADGSIRAEGTTSPDTTAARGGGGAGSGN